MNQDSYCIAAKVTTVGPVNKTRQNKKTLFPLSLGQDRRSKTITQNKSVDQVNKTRPSNLRQRSRQRRNPDSQDN